MVIDTEQFLERYPMSLATLNNRIKDKTLNPIRGNSRRDGNLYDQEECDRLALEGKLGSKAKKNILNIISGDATEEHN